MKSVVICLFAAALFAGDGPSDSTAPDLSTLSIEQLMEVTATSILKRPDKPSQAAAAIYIVTAEDIRRSGMTSIPELLRLVPGMDVAQEDATTWSISARGFANQTSDKMLVLIDGRRVYDPLIAGVFWDAQDVPLYDIAQIEVIRGPGSSLWGADAVNGVINIITRHARETQGLLVSVGGGNTEGGAASVQYGAKLGPRAYFRIFGKYNREDLLTPDQDPHVHEPDIATGRGGFRVDSELTNQDSLTVEGDFYSGTIGRYLLQTNQLTTNRDGGDLLARWIHRLRNGGETTLQVFWDHTDRSFDGASWLRNTVDVDFEHQFTAARIHNIVWGIRGDYSYDRSNNSPMGGLLPSRLGFKTFDGFVQDEIPLAGNLFQLIAGSKFEHNDYTGFEWQPNIRLAWTPTELQTIWMGVSRGLVVPSRSNRAGYINLPPAVLSPGTLPVTVTSTPNPNFGSQDLLAYEAGYRTTIRSNLTLDLVGFYNIYNHLLTEEIASSYFSTNPEPNIVMAYQVGNNMRGTTHGAELSATWKASERWKLTGSYSWLKMQLQLMPGSNDLFAVSGTGRSPQHQLQFHSYLDLPHHFELDGAVYFSSALPYWNVTPYTRCDLRAGWRWGDYTDFSLVGQNLLDPRHVEAVSEGELPATSIHRSFYGRIEWRF